jgi:hypothetical protein
MHRLEKLVLTDSPVGSSREEGASDCTSSGTRASTCKARRASGSLFTLRKTYSNESIEVRVTQELNAFIQLITFYQLSGDREKRLSTCRFIQREICNFSGLKRVRPVAVPFGSFKYGTYLPWSGDLDVVITDKPILQTGNLLESLAEHFRDLDCLAAAPVVVPRARVPFLQLWVLPAKISDSQLPQPVKCSVCASSGSVARCPAHSPLLVQLSLSGRNHLGLATSSYASTMVKALPALRPLTLLLKHILTCVGLNSSFNGGMSSHTTLLLVVAYLRHQYGSAKDYSLGRLAIGLLEWYGRDFDAATTAVTPGEVRAYRTRIPDEATELLIVTDPMDSGQNAARSLWRWAEVRSAFEAALGMMLEGGWWPSLVATIENQQSSDK